MGISGFGDGTGAVVKARAVLFQFPMGISGFGDLVVRLSRETSSDRFNSLWELAGLVTRLALWRKR